MDIDDVAIISIKITGFIMFSFYLTAGLLMILPGGKSAPGNPDEAALPASAISENSVLDAGLRNPHGEAGLCCGDGVALMHSGQPVPSPCSAAIRVALGEVDKRFNLTHEELKSEIREVAGLWSAAADQPVVVYDEEEGLPVHFVYEDQQELTDQEREARMRIQRVNTEVEGMEKDLREKESLYQQEVAAYEAESAVLESRIEHLNQWVRKINEKGGFNETELRQFHYRKQGVDRAAESLEGRQEQLYESGFEISSRVADINRRIEEKNRLIDDYNLRFSGVHYLTQGVYEWNASDRAIHIYQFAGRDDLRFVLAHEIGHALGIDHVADPSAVMYHTIGEQQQNQLMLTETDITALRQVCTR